VVGVVLAMMVEWLVVGYVCSYRAREIIDTSCSAESHPITGLAADAF